jgi:hypothetical protein
VLSKPDGRTWRTNSEKENTLIKANMRPVYVLVGGGCEIMERETGAIRIRDVPHAKVNETILLDVMEEVPIIDVSPLGIFFWDAVCREGIQEQATCQM